MTPDSRLMTPASWPLTPLYYCQSLGGQGRPPLRTSLRPLGRHSSNNPCVSAPRNEGLCDIIAGVIRVRLFFSLTIDAKTRKILAALSWRMQQKITARAAWVKEENLHITTKFLGEVDSTTIDDLSVISRRVTERIAPFILTIDRIDAFPSLATPRVIWVGGKGPPQFIELVDRLERELERLGFPAEQRRPIPHITMARIKGRREQDIEEKIRAISLPDALQVEVSQLTLNKSRLTSKGPIYTPLLELPLTG